MQVLGVYLLTDSVQVAQKKQGDQGNLGVAFFGQGQLALSPSAREL